VACNARNWWAKVFKDVFREWPDLRIRGENSSDLLDVGSVESTGERGNDRTVRAQDDIHNLKAVAW